MTQKDEVLALGTLSQVRQSDIDAMSFRELDDFVGAGVQILTLHRASIIQARKAMRPAIWRMHDALSRQGKRTDLLDAPDGLTFGQWIKSKEKNLGSRATIYRLLKDAGLTPTRQLAEGTKVKVRGKGEAGIVTHVHEGDGGVPKADVLFKGKKAVTCVAEKLVRVTVRRIAVGDLLVFEDKQGVEYRYVGGGKIVLVGAPSKAGQKKPCGTAKAGQAKAAAAGRSI
ncbi:MAG TPA: hypothetical protein VJX47_04815 [Candidatus Sulfotelmatobacter sp.]|nr:hypothetical protein [Candidatus Sulfotelmatobacter sp.]